jgi:diguanylate cyclase (GGDEF)-like protein
MPLPTPDARLSSFIARLDGASLKSAMRGAAAGVVELLGDWGACVLLEPRPHIFVTTDDPHAGPVPIDLGHYPELVAALETHALVAIEDTRSSPLLDPVRALLPPRIGAIAVVPLHAGRDRLGALIARSRGPRQMAAEDRTTAQALGSVAALLVAAHRQHAPRPTPLAVERVVTPVMGVQVLARQPRRILVAEDDPDQAEALAGLLMDEGHEVSIAVRGDEALAKVFDVHPELVLLDVNLPGLDGFAVAEAMAVDRRSAAIPVVMLSAVGNLPVRVRDCRRGELDFLAKPYLAEELLARVERSLQSAEAHLQLERTARIDELTGLGNLRLLDERMAVEEARAVRYATPLSLAVADVDGLKQINDRHGHATGSAVLQAIGQALRREVRDTDLAVRYGGDEFVVLLPHSDLAAGAAFAERLLGAIRRLRVDEVRPSVSVGVACFDPHRDETVRRLLVRADRAAYRAKQIGGDRLWIDETG